MLAIQRKQAETGTLSVNVLPCKINYDGPVDADTLYWKPAQTEDGKNTVYFRGRGLEGNVMKVPEGYTGAILRITDDVIPVQRSTAPQDDEDDEEDQVMEETKAVQELGTFDEVTVWNHDKPWDATENPYVKGIDEWLSFSKAIHSQETETEESPASEKRS